MTCKDLPCYTITILGVLDPDWSSWLNGFAVHSGADARGACVTVLTGPVPDQAALRGLLNRIWDLNLELVALSRDKCASVKDDAIS